MKKDSWFFPIEMPGNSLFDSNKDGKISGFETIVRDSFWLEQQRRWNEEHNKKNK